MRVHLGCRVHLNHVGRSGPGYPVMVNQACKILSVSRWRTYCHMIVGTSIQEMVPMEALSFGILPINPIYINLVIKIQQRFKGTWSLVFWGTACGTNVTLRHKCDTSAQELPELLLHDILRPEVPLTVDHWRGDLGSYACS